MHTGADSGARGGFIGGVRVPSVRRSHGLSAAAGAESAAASASSFPTAFFPGGVEDKIRQKFVEENLLEAVIGLSANLFFGNGIPAAILIFNKDNTLHRPQCRVVGASDFYRRNIARTYYLLRGRALP